MVLHDVACDSCGYTATKQLKNPSEYREKCSCPGGVISRVFVKAPMGRVGADGSDRQLGDMKRSFNERFIKSGEMDAVRHKHGDDFNDSLVSAAVKRVKEGKA
jgi:hypothetical protein